ncbi:unnamed protein product [Choristocarpus tenellus]
MLQLYLALITCWDAMPGLKIVGVEPIEAMRREFKQALPEVHIVEGTGEAIPLPHESALAVIAAQSFHWMSTPDVLKEIHRVLLPGGLLALIWNTRDVSVPWVRALDDIIDPFYGPSVPRQQSGRWRDAFVGMEGGGVGTREKRSSTSSLFGPLTERHFRHSQQPESEQLEAIRKAKELVETHEGTQEDVIQGRGIDLPYDTEVYWCRKM